MLNKIFSHYSRIPRSLNTTDMLGCQWTHQFGVYIRQLTRRAVAINNILNSAFFNSRTKERGQVRSHCSELNGAEVPLQSPSFNTAKVHKRLSVEIPIHRSQTQTDRPIRRIRQYSLNSSGTSKNSRQQVCGADSHFGLQV